MRKSLPVLVAAIVGLSIVTLPGAASAKRPPRPSDPPTTEPTPPPPTSWSAPYEGASGGADATTGTIDIGAASRTADDVSSVPEETFERGNLHLTQELLDPEASIAFTVETVIDEVTASALAGSSEIRARLFIDGRATESELIADSSALTIETTGPRRFTFAVGALSAGSHDVTFQLEASASPARMQMPTWPCSGTWLNPCPEHGGEPTFVVVGASEASIRMTVTSISTAAGAP